MSPDALLREIDGGALRPVYVLLGAEHFLRDRWLSKLRAAAVDAEMAEFNAERLVAGECSVEAALDAANQLPMMADRRYIEVRQVERWEPRGDGGSSEAMDRLAGYTKAPNPSTVLVLVADALDARRKLMQQAKSEDYVVQCAPLSERELEGFVRDEAQGRGHPIDRDVAAHIAQLAGPELFQLADAIERLSLYVGPGAPIDEDAVAHSLTRLRVEDSWALVDALRRRDAARSLALLARVYDPRDRGLPLLGALAWSVRQLLRLQGALHEGLRVDEAARKAGVFNAQRGRELADSLRGARPLELESLLEVLATADRALKGSKVPPLQVLEGAVLRMCRP